jgi:hypothetical protein
MLAPLACFVLAAGCFEIDPPQEDAGVVGSALNGRILIVGSQATAQSAAIDQGMRRTRSAMRRLDEGQPVRAGDLGPSQSATLAPLRRKLDGNPPRGQVKDATWAAGQAIVGFAQGRYTEKAEIQQVLDQVMTRARVDPREVTARVELCTALMFCRVTLTDPTGKALDVEATARVAGALHEQRGTDFVVLHLPVALRVREAAERVGHHHRRPQHGHRRHRHRPQAAAPRRARSRDPRLRHDQQRGHRRRRRRA